MERILTKWPNFIGIGAQRAGTTWVYNCLKQHPEIYLPEKKELQYFNAFYDHGPEWYQSNFSSTKKDQCVGEITPNYLHSPHAIERISKDIPDVKLFLILRNPFERAYSSYMLFNNNLCKGLSFSEACRKQNAIIRQGLYAKAIERLYQYFPRTQVKILLYDDLQKDNQKFLDEIFEFVGVTTGWVPDNIKVRYNKIMFPKIQNFLIKYHMEWFIEGVKKTVLNKMIRQTYKSVEDKKKSAMSKADYEYLKGFFEGDIYATQEIIGRNLESWLKFD